MAGKNACPQEDSGGIHHYQHLVKILQNPKHPQYADFASWLPENHDPTFFDLKALNIELKRFSLFWKENPKMTSSPWQMTAR